MDKDVSCYVAVVPAAIDSGRIIVHFSIRNVKSNISYYWSVFPIPAAVNGPAKAII